MSFYVVVYTGAHLIGAVSAPMDLDQCAALTDQFSERKVVGRYTFVCEEHEKQPKLQTTISAHDRKLFKRNCIEAGFPMQCEDMPNGDVQYLTSARDKHGHRIIETVRKKDRTPEFYFKAN